MINNFLTRKSLHAICLAFMLCLTAFSINAEEQQQELVEEIVEEELPFAGLPYAARMELNESLLTIWEFVDEGGDVVEARRLLLGYLRTPEGREFVAGDLPLNSYMYQVLLTKAGLLAGFLKNTDKRSNKGMHWFTQGLLRIYEKKSAQASSNFVKGIFSALQLEVADYQRLESVGIEMKYFPSMTSYSNAAFMAVRFAKMSYPEQQQILNVAIAEKIAKLELLPEEILDPTSTSYQLQALYYNLGAFLVLEGDNDLFAVQELFDKPDDLFNILKEKFGYDAREIFQRH